MLSNDVLTFWLEEMGPPKWYAGGPEIDALIKRKFGPAAEHARSGDYDDWAETAQGALALIILLDQFSRNIHRNNAMAFAGDDKAVDLARSAIERDLDQEIDCPARQFFFLPFMHSETLSEQDECVRLFQTRMTPEEAGGNMLHAEAHRDVIRFFGRFPYRNAALGRETTDAEALYLKHGAYGLSMALRGPLKGLSPV